MEVLEILPKKIYKFNYFPDNTIKKFIFNVIKEISNQEDYDMFPKNYIISQSDVPLNFKFFIEKSIKNVLSYERIRYESFYISLMWLNYHDKINNNMHLIHNHQNSIFSGVYYFENNDNGITFFDDEQCARYYDFQTIDDESYFPKKQYIQTLTNDLIIFRSDLSHAVTRFDLHKNQKRISLAFNINLIGIGSKNKLTFN